MPHRWPTAAPLLEDKLAINFRAGRTGHRRGTKARKKSFNNDPGV